MPGSVAKAYVQVIPSADGIKGKLSSVFSSEMPSAGQSAGGVFGSSLIGKVKGLVAAAGLGKLLSESLQAGADMQQSLGGIETLFKDSADTVIKNAEQAYKTAGMSANQYMEMVTGFSASLLQGLSGDTEAAASVADMALTDMADNANKMGTSMESIQNAYQGFAKQNYTMLDNLKLGYGGTKTEMQRLLADAQKLSGVKYDINNLADVYSAIHVIQEEMDITGTTAKESASTFSGSMASMKAAFSDVLANLSLGRDIGPSLRALGETVHTFIVGNLVPMFGNILTALPEVLSTALNMAIQGLNLMAANADAIVQMGTDLVLGLGSAIITAAPYLLEAAWNLIAALGNAIITTDWAQIASDTIDSLRGSLDIAAGEILGTDGNIVGSFMDAIFSGFPDILETGGDMVGQLVDGIASCLPDLVKSGLDLFVEFTGKLISLLPGILDTGEEMLLSLVDGMRQCYPDILRAAGSAVSELLSGILVELPTILDAGFDLIVNLIQGIGEALPDVIEAAQDVCAELWETIKETDWLQLGMDIIDGLINGIGGMASALWDAAVNIANACLNAIKKALGIASPSKVMRDKIGKWIPPGVAVGIEANTKPLTDAMHDLSAVTTDTLKSDLDITGALSESTAVLAVSGARQQAASPETVLYRLLEAVEDMSELNRAGHDASLLAMRDLLEAVLNIRIGDDVIAGAVDRYNTRRRMMGGVAI